MSVETSARSKTASQRCRLGDRQGGCVIRVSVEVCSGATRFRATVCAEGIEQALSVVSAHYPSAEATVLFPIDPEVFFAKGSALVPSVVLPETQELEAG